MARPAHIDCDQDAWTQLTEDESGTAFSAVVKSGMGEMLATSTGTAPSDSDVGLPFSQGEGFSNKALTDLFHGVSSPVRLYFRARGDNAVVYADHN